MTSSLTDAAIVPITLTVNGRIGLTLYAPPWEDEDGEEWQGFLGDGAKILLYPGTRELADFIASGEENDLSDHPAWGYVQKLTPDELRPGGEDAYDLDAVYEWASGEPDPVHVSALANVVDMVGRIADCCDDGALRRLVEGTPAYAELVDDDVSYHGKDGRRPGTSSATPSPTRGSARSATSRSGFPGRATSRRATSRARPCGTASTPNRSRSGSPTSRTSRCAGSSRKTPRTKPTAAFIGGEDTVAVFTEVADLARYCRTAKDHRLVKLEWWSELAEVEDDEVFTPALDANYDLRKPSGRGARAAARVDRVLQPRHRRVGAGRSVHRSRRLARRARRGRDELRPWRLTDPAPASSRYHALRAAPPAGHDDQNLRDRRCCHRSPRRLPHSARPRHSRRRPRPRTAATAYPACGNHALVVTNTPSDSGDGSQPHGAAVPQQDRAHLHAATATRASMPSAATAHVLAHAKRTLNGYLGGGRTCAPSSSARALRGGRRGVGELQPARRTATAGSRTPCW